MAKNLKGYTENGGEIHLRSLSDGSIQRGAKGLSSGEMSVYKKAALYADKKNGGDWNKAETLLKKAGFEILYE